MVRHIIETTKHSTLLQEAAVSVTYRVVIILNQENDSPLTLTT